jgi:hypothetical protein
MHDRNDPRQTELHNLRVALAMFALQLDAFEARMSRLTRPVAAKRKPVLSNVTKPTATRSEKPPSRLSGRSG